MRLNGVILNEIRGIFHLYTSLAAAHGDSAARGWTERVDLSPTFVYVRNDHVRFIP
jgi:hypothetical protein